MQKWKSTVKLGDLHSKFQAGELTVAQVAHALAERLQGNKYADDLGDFIDGLRSLDNESTKNDYDNILDELYDFGERGKRIWLDPW